MSLASQTNDLAARVAAQFKALPQPRVHINFRRKSAGASPTKTDSGHSVTTIKTNAGIADATIDSSGRETVANLGTIAGAVYRNCTPLPRKVMWIGGVVQFSSNTAGSAAAFIAWNDQAMSPISAVDSHLHLAIGPNNWSFGYVIDQSVTTLRNEPFVMTPNKDYRVDVFIEGTTAYVVIDGIVTPITDANIGSLTGSSAGWEYVRSTTGEAIPYVVEFWANDSISEPGLLHPLYVYKALNPPPRAVAHSVAGNLILDTATPGDINVTATANADLYPGTTGVPFGRKIVVSVLASGGARTIAVHAAVPVNTGVTRSYSVASGKVVTFGFIYSALSGTWICLASGVQE